MLCIYEYKNTFVRATKQHFNYTMRYVTLHKTSCLYIHTYIFENELFPATVVKRNTWLR